jgi:proteic killer suppression protein
MIRSFRDTKTGALFQDKDVPRFRSIELVAHRKLLYLHRAGYLEDLRVPPCNRLEALKGDRKGQYGMGINDFGTSPDVWMGLQTDYELRIAQRTIGPEVEKRVHRHAV